MSKTVVALDCMGGDFAPVETVKAAVEALRENKEVYIGKFHRKNNLTKRCRLCISQSKLLQLPCQKGARNIYF